MERFVVRGASLLDMPLRVLDLLARQGAAVSRVFVDKEGDDYRVLVEASTPAAGLIVEKIRSMVLVSSVEHFCGGTACVMSGGFPISNELE